MQITEDGFEERRAKRQKLLRKKRRKRIIISLVLLLLATAIILSLTVFFKIKTVRAGGSTVYSENDIVTAANIKKENLFLISREKLEDRIRKKLPFVSKIKIKRNLPDILTITVTDAKEYCYFSNGDKFYTLSEDGYILKEYNEPPAGLKQIVCSGFTAVLGEKLKYNSAVEEKAVLELMQKLDEKSIDYNTIDVSNIASLKITVNNRFNVNLGTNAYLDKKISHLMGMINSIGENRKGDIDLSMWTPSKSEGSFIEKQ